MGVRTGWTQKDLEKKKAEGTIRDFTPVGPEVKKPGRAKYRNKKVEWDGMVFDSTKEYKQYRFVLLERLKKGEIGQLRRQVRYKLIVNDELIATYIADHVYIEATTGEEIVEDVKSEITRKLPLYVLKKNLMKSIHNIEIKEV